MHFRSLAILLLCSLAVGQAAPSPSSKPAEKLTTAPAEADKSAKTAAESSSVAPSAAVITVDGICDTPPAAAKAAPAAKSKTACKTVITRAQFEDLASALQPNMNPAMKRRLADVYPKMLVMAYEARKRGLENDPKYKQVLQFARLQILSQELSKSLKEDSDKVPEADIEKYYKDNATAFQQADLKRLFVPKDKQSETGENAAEDADEAQPDQKSPQKSGQKAPDQKPAEQESADQKKADPEAQKKADEEAMKKEAETIHTRAAAGEDFDKLQKEAFETASIKGTPPSTSVGKLTSNEVPVNHRAVFDLKPGDISDVIAEPNGYYIYKVVSKGTKPLDQARDQIRATLAQQKMQDTVQKIQDEAKTTLNEAYFTVPAAVPGMPGMSGAGTPPAGSGGVMRMPAGAASPASTAKPADSGQTPPPPPPAPHN
jgi:bifunctional DNA-binding transcriptional regulator/antitoxin component of YhaV-PrlF toxin-antitoxin module